MITITYKDISNYESRINEEFSIEQFQTFRTNYSFLTERAKISYFILNNRNLNLVYDYPSKKFMIITVNNHQFYDVHDINEIKEIISMFSEDNIKRINDTYKKYYYVLGESKEDDISCYSSYHINFRFYAEGKTRYLESILIEVQIVKIDKKNSLKISKHSYTYSFINLRMLIRNIDECLKNKAYIEKIVLKNKCKTKLFEILKKTYTDKIKEINDL